MLESYHAASRSVPPAEVPLTGAAALVKSAVNPGYTYLSADVINDEIYIYGGLANNAASGRLIKYNPQTGAITTLLSGAARYAVATIAYNGKLYTFGGYNGSAAVNTAASYDPLTNKWTALTTLPVALYGAAVFVYNAKIYIIGGYTGSANATSLYVYDPVKNTYQAIAIPTAQRTYFAAYAQLNGLCYMVGGVTNPTLNRIYNPATNTWSQGPSLPDNRYEANAVANNKQVYVIGGINVTFMNWFNTAQSTLYALNGSWTQLGAPLAGYSMPLVLCWGRVYWIGVDVYRLT